MLVQKNFSDIVTFARATTRWRTGPAGLLVQDAINAASLAYDPVTLLPRGLLVEGQKTNVQMQSSGFDNVIWSKTNCTITPNAAVDPVGTSVAQKLVEGTAANSVSRATGNVISKAASAIEYTASVYVKAAGRNFVRVGMDDSSGSGAAVWFSLTDGAIGASTGTGTTAFTNISGKVSQLANGWYRCAITATTTTTTVIRFLVDPSTTNAIGGNLYTGDGVSGIYLFGAQLEVGAFPSSYIPTTSASVTRSADSTLITDLSKIAFNPIEGTFYAEFMRTFSDGANAALNGRLISRDSMADGIIGTSSGNFIETYSGGVALRTGNQFTPSVAAKAAVSYSSAGRSLCLNGGTVASDANPLVVPTQLISIGSAGSSSNTNNFNGFIRDIRYIPRRLSNAELQALTA
ncbi:MAG: hypothetical protein V4468_03440 [Pseudomonadota bacterium]